MNWRIAGAGLVALLLIVPMVLLLHGMWPVRPRALEEWEANVSPMLTSEERSSRTTYWRACTRSADCEPPLGCLTHSAFKEPICADSQCETDAQCREGTACQVVRTEGKGPWVRLCRTVGVRKEGEECGGLLALGRERACEQGWVCGNYRCGRPCRLGEPTSCPEDFYCAENLHAQPTCLPTCEKRGCPTGQSCVRHFTGASTCAVVPGTHCQDTPCPAGQRCVVFTRPERPSEARMTCLQDCGGEHPPCPAGNLCVAETCRKACESQSPDACEPGFQCIQKDPSLPGFCQVAW